MKHLIITGLLMFTAFHAGCANQSSEVSGEAASAAAKETMAKAGETADSTAYKAAYAAAAAAVKKASAIGGEWRDTGKIMKKAEDAAKAGDYKKAISLTNTAKLQAENGYEQAKNNTGAALRM